MKIDCDVRLMGLYPTITFEDGTVWEIPITEWEKMMDVILTSSIRDKYRQTDFAGFISKKKYNAAKECYQDIVKRFKLK